MIDLNTMNSSVEMLYIECLKYCEIWTALHLSAKQIFAFLKPKAKPWQYRFQKMKSVEIWERQSTKKN